MKELMLNFNMDNWVGALLALIPALINIAVFYYILFRLPKSKISTIFSFFVIALAIWQLNDTMVRLSADVKTAAFWNYFLSIGSLLIAPTGFHFALLFTGRKKIAESYRFLLLLYAPVLIFLALIKVGVTEVPMHYTPIWGWNFVPNKNPVVIGEAVWVSILSIATFCLLLFHAFSVRRNDEKKKQALLIAMGLAIPTIQGVLTQVIFPNYFGKDPIPVTSTFMSFFSVATIIALSRYSLFDISPAITANAVLANMNDILLVATKQGTIEYINPAGAKTLGIDTEEIEQYLVSDLFSEDSEDYINFKTNILDKVYLRKTIKMHDSVIRAKDGEKISVSISVSPIHFKTETEGLLLIIKDITEQRKTEEALQLQTTLYENLLRAQSEMGEGVSIVENGRFVYVNDALCKIYGYTKEELFKMHSFLDIVVPAERPLLEMHLRERILGNKEMVDSGETIIVTKSGHLVNIAYSYKILNNQASGSVFSIVRDITEKKYAESELAKLALIVETTADAVTTSTPEGVYTTWNKSAEYIYGYRAEEIIGKNTPLDFTPPAWRDGMREVLERGKAGQQVKDYHTKRIRKDKKIIDIAITVTPIFDNKNKVVLLSGISRDITNQKESEEKLMRMASIVEYSNDSIIEISAEGIIINWNPGSEKLYGYNAKETIGKPFVLLVPETDTKDAIAEIERIYRGEHTDQRESKRARKNGTEIYVSETLSLIKNKDGEIKSISVIARDITEKKYAEELIRKNQEKLALAQQIAKLGSWEWDTVNNVMSWSDQMFRTYGLNAEDFDTTPLSVTSFVHPGDLPFVNKIFKNAFKNHQPFSFEQRIIRPGASQRTLYVKGEVLTDQNNKTIKIFGTSLDISERKREKELEKLSLVASRSFNAVTISDKNGKIEWVNNGFTTLTGYTLEDVKGTRGEILTLGKITGISPESEYFKKIVREKHPITYENKNYTKSGEGYWTLTSLTPVLNEKGEVEKIISIDSDISRQKKAEEDLILANKVAEHSLYQGTKALEELKSAKKEIEESLKIKDQFLANMSHEIRTPMNAIVGFTDIILKSPMTPEHEQYIKAIKTSSENLLVIINDILDFSKLESGKVVFEEIDFDIRRVVTSMTELMLPKSVEKGVRLSSSFDSSIPEYIKGDPTRLNQVLVNLVGNAIKFTHQGSVKIDIKLEKETTDAVEILFSVSDTGIGIPKKTLPSIFESFTQATNDTSRKYGGTGLGLTITKQLIEQLGGNITVQSEVKKGSVFSFALKFKRSAGISAAKSAVADNDNEFTIEGIRVLLVEDNEFNQMLAKKILSDWKWDVDVADNGLIAVEKMKACDFDVILMDIQLPEMDGYQATRYIRSKLSQPKCVIPIIAMTAHAISGEVERCISAGMNDYISKPFNQKVLYQKVITAVGKGKTSE